MGNQLTDLSGRPIPTPQAKASIERMIAVPPVRDRPNEDSQEFLLSGYSNLAAGGAGFVQLTDPITGLDFASRVSNQFDGRIDSIHVFCPDMVTDVAPYLFWQMTIDAQLANAWGVVPVYPRAGVASLSFDSDVDLSPNQIIRLFGKNTDAANTHFLAVYLYGWFWPKDIVQG